MPQLKRLNPLATSHVELDLPSHGTNPDASRSTLPRYLSLSCVLLALQYPSIVLSRNLRVLMRRASNNYLHALCPHSDLTESVTLVPKLGVMLLR
jgi:hypothetical protein